MVKRVVVSSSRAVVLGLVSSLLSASVGVMGVSAADPFAEGVRTTEPLSPEQERAAFRVPPGFEMQLVTAEPAILKPMNMAFDARGRLWVTVTREYPFPAPLDKPARDQIKVLSDFGPDGRARKVETFAEGLNIPIGLLPYKRGVIAWSIPNVWYLEDTDGDGKADRKEKLFGPLGWERDTHGNISSFRRGFDGWIYGTHGFNNNSTFVAKDGSTITVNSGNTYRFRPDGSRIEQHTWGQVNPFGLGFDDWGNLFSADCHSAPVYQLLRGGYYPSFGKPHDGLGFAPVLMEHSHGSTAIAGITVYNDDQWPAEFRENVFIGNVMTSRVNRDRLEYQGSSPRARELPDLVSTTDPWFRPVDVQLGPDGALYIADFYNRIIGHYEVPLTHPGRDRESGRIWRLVYRGGPGGAPQRWTEGLPDFTRMEPRQLAAELRSANLPRRLLATHELVDRGSTVLPVVQPLLSRSNPGVEAVHALWVLQRLDALDTPTLKRAVLSPNPLVRAHAFQVLGEKKGWSSAEQDWVIAGFTDDVAMVQRSAVQAAGLQPSERFVQPLLRRLRDVFTSDDHLKHALRMALRNQLRDLPQLGGLAGRSLGAGEAALVADLLPGVPSPAAAGFLLAHLRSNNESAATAGTYLRHVARYGDAQQFDSLGDFVQEKYGKELDLQVALFQSLNEGAKQRGAGMSGSVKRWAEALALQLCDTPEKALGGWSSLPAAELVSPQNPWFLQRRTSADGNADSVFLCSLPPGGESWTGTLRSPEFTVPGRLGFYAAGHDGFPDKPAQGRNRIRLVDAATGEVLVQSGPPRNDIAQRIEWDLTRFAGRRARLEVMDSDTAGAFAWLAVGRFDAGMPALPSTSPSQVATRLKAAATLAQTAGLEGLRGRLASVGLQGPVADPQVVREMAVALAGFARNELWTALAAVMGEPGFPASAATAARRELGAATPGNPEPVVLEVFKLGSSRVQQALARSLSGTGRGAAQLLAWLEGRQVSLHLLADKPLADKLRAMPGTGQKERVEALVKLAPSLDAGLQQLIDARAAGFVTATVNREAGAALFKQHCAVCHKIGNEGGLVGPQLEGIGGRGAARVVEDILDPNRNVDLAFRSQLVVLKDGDVVSGLPRREEGATLVLADSTGKDVVVEKTRIQSRRDSDTSLMPSNFGDLLTEQQLNDLLGFLLAAPGK